MQVARIAIEWRCKFEKNLVSSVGDFDQFLFTKTRQAPNQFEEDLGATVKHLLKHGVENLHLICPIPSPHFGTNDLKAGQVYQRIKEAYDAVKSRNLNHVRLLKFNFLVGKRIDGKCGIFRDKDGHKMVNFCLYSNAFMLTHNCRTVLSKPILIM